VCNTRTRQELGYLHRNSRAQFVASACEGVDVVVHLAGTPDDADFETDILPNNVMGMHNLLQAAVACRVKRIVFASSMQVNWYQLINDSTITPPPPPISPSDAVSPRLWCVPLPLTLTLLLCFVKQLSRYASAKLFCEGIGCAFAFRNGVTFIAARLGWCPRPGQQARRRPHTPTRASSAIALRPILTLQNGRRTHT
jgi:uronate dehydrogenase